MRGRTIASAVCTLIAASCRVGHDPIVDVETAGDAAFDDRGAEDPGGDEGNEDGGSEDSGGVVDGDAPDVVVSCTSGQVLPAVLAFNASPLISSYACNVDGALAVDGSLAGLARTADVQPDCEDWSGGGSEYACGCVGVDLGSVQPVDRIVARVGAAESACGDSCSPPQCNSGHSFNVFVGISTGSYALVESVPLVDGALGDYELPASGQARYVVVCREGWGEGRDNIVVDVIEARCR